jgi:hypothetical protein
MNKSAKRKGGRKAAGGRTAVAALAGLGPRSAIRHTGAAPVWWTVWGCGTKSRGSQPTPPPRAALGQRKERWPLRRMAPAPPSRAESIFPPRPQLRRRAGRKKS